MATPRTPRRRYVKGEKRYKHVSRTSEPEFRVHRGNPKKVTGLCPNDIALPTCEEVLEAAIPGPTGGPVGTAPRRLYAFHREIIFEFKLSDHERSYHAYPLRGAMPKRAASQLRATLESEAERRAFDRWVDEHIQ